MCITSSRSILDNTYIGAWDINHPTHGYRHVLAYQNRVKNLSQGPNCMLLPIQSAQPIHPDCLIDTTEQPDFLTDLYEVVYPTGLENDGNWMSWEDETTNYVVEQGVYHIALLNDCSEEAVERTLKQIPATKLPKLTTELLDFFRANYTDFPLLLCCFDNKAAQQATPILVHYLPRFPEVLMANALDAHDGIPKIGQQISFHQKIILGSYKKDPAPNKKPYTKIPANFYPALRAFLPEYATTIDLLHRFNGPNNDFCFPLQELHQGEVPSVQLGILGQENSSIDIAVQAHKKTLHLQPIRR